jgi:anaerobic selenocysteine-containing dehydrogenase
MAHYSRRDFLKTGVAAGALASAGALPLRADRKAADNSVPQVLIPNPDIGVESLAARKKAQLETLDQLKVFCEFQFTNKVKESGITFVNRAVEDEKKA